MTTVATAHFFLLVSREGIGKNGVPDVEMKLKLSRKLGSLTASLVLLHLGSLCHDDGDDLLAAPFK